MGIISRDGSAFESAFERVWLNIRSSISNAIQRSARTGINSRRNTTRATFSWQRRRQRNVEILGAGWTASRYCVLSQFSSEERERGAATNKVVNKAAARGALGEKAFVPPARLLARYVNGPLLRLCDNTRERRARKREVCNYRFSEKDREREQSLASRGRSTGATLFFTAPFFPLSTLARGLAIDSVSSVRLSSALHHTRNSLENSALFPSRRISKGRPAGENASTK